MSCLPDSRVGMKYDCTATIVVLTGIHFVVLNVGCKGERPLAPTHTGVVDSL